MQSSCLSGLLQQFAHLSHSLNSLSSSFSRDVVPLPCSRRMGGSDALHQAVRGQRSGYLFHVLEL